MNLKKKKIKNFFIKFKKFFIEMKELFFKLL